MLPKISALNRINPDTHPSLGNMRVWCSLGAARRSPWRPHGVPAARVASNTVAGRSAVTLRPCSPTHGVRNASSEAPNLRNWSADREDVRFRFRCTQCGKCCTGRGGRVRINERELQQIAKATRESVERVKDKYVRPNESSGAGGGSGWLLRQSSDDAHCVFLDGNKCSIYQGTR